MSNLDRQPRAIVGGGLVVLAAAVFALAAWNSAGHLDTLWDERVDLDIAEALRRAPVCGESPPLDASQMRLPMYVCAAAGWVRGWLDLPVARAVSVAASAAGILLAAGLAWRLFGGPVAVLSAWLLALSPYYLAFGRIAMTEGDALLAVCVTGTIWAFLWFADRPMGRRWLLSGTCLGLAVGAKAYAALLAVPLLICLPRANLSGRTDSAPRVRQKGFAIVAGVLVAALAMGQLGGGFGPAAWVAVSIGWLVIAAMAWRADLRGGGRMEACLGIVLIAALSWAAFMPEHVTQPGIVRELARRFVRWDHRAPGAMLIDHVRLYLGILLIKATLPVGALTVAGLIRSMIRARRAVGPRLLVLMIALWIGAMCTLPLRQTFYLMGIYPLVMILTAEFTIHVAGLLAHRSGIGAAAAGLLVVGPVAWLGVRSAAAYPDYQLFGYDLVGTRWLGAESRGYRNLIQTNSDGVETLGRWCLENVPPGARVVSYLWEDHILDRLLPGHLPFTLVRRGVTLTGDVLPPPPDFGSADFVLLHVNNVLGYGDRPPDAPPADRLEREFDPAFTVSRLGGRVAVAWVYARRDGAGKVPASGR